MKLPNGFGQISKLKKPLRNPWRAMVTVGTAENGRPICKLLKPQAYFKTYNDAYAALMDYHRNPYDLDTANITIEELYERWYKVHTKHLAKETARCITTAWRRCTGLYNMKAKDLKPGILKAYIENCQTGEVLKRKMRNLFNMMYDYAIEYEIVDKNPAQFKFSTNLERPTSAHIAFTEDEISILWQHLDLDGIDMILIQCYTGWRPQELININVEDIQDGFIRGGMKTDAGKNRLVPIHPKISKLLDNRIAGRTEGRLFKTRSDKFYDYSWYRKQFAENIRQLGLNSKHAPHDCRKTFVTLCKKYKVDEYAIKRIVGHKISDLTESVYTERPKEWLMEEAKKIQ